nr:PepSY domain-containing protein [uncultured Psychroserpens sp.]
MPKSKFNFHKFNRRIHLYAGLFMIPYIFIFGLSGIIFNHPTILNDRSFDSFILDKEESFASTFPDVEKLATSITNSIVRDGLISNPEIKNIKYNGTMILRSMNDVADYRMNVDIPTSKVQLLTLPDFVNNTEVSSGNYATSNINSKDLLYKAEQVLKKQDIVPGKSRIQRIPNLEFDLENDTGNYRVTYNYTSGNYRVNDLGKRKFKLNYLLTNLHQVHGYPVAGFSVQWLWVFFADSLAVLMIIWAISGLIMWFKMKRLFTIGVILLSISMLVFIIILINSYEFGF